MGAALITVNAGIATVYSSGDLSSLAGVSTLSDIIITKNAQTPAGDPVVVDLTTGLAGVSALSGITVQNGATAKVGGGLLNANVGTGLTVNGGVLDLQSNLIDAKVLHAVNVGPEGGEIKVEPTGLSVGVLDLPINFVDAHGNSTNTIPANFVMDFPSAKSIPAYYDKITNTTTIGDGISLLGVVGVGRTITLQGDVFDLKDKGTAIGRPAVLGYSYNFTQSDGNGGVITCYLSGSMIRTPNGDVTVEDIRIGDEIVTFDWRNNKDVVHPVVWVGKAHATVRPDLS
ncbi:Hint domain-containing protein, partial [Acetobacter pasteurianus]